MQKFAEVDKWEITLSSQLEDLVDLPNATKMRMLLRRSVPIPPENLDVRQIGADAAEHQRFAVMDVLVTS